MASSIALEKILAEAMSGQPTDAIAHKLSISGDAIRKRLSGLRELEAAQARLTQVIALLSL